MQTKQKKRKVDVIIIHSDRECTCNLCDLAGGAGTDLFVSQALLGLGSAHGTASPMAGAAKSLLHGALSAH